MTTTKTASLLVLACLLTGCASQKPHRVTPIAAPTNTIQYTATVAKKSIESAIQKVQKQQPECVDPDIIADLQRANKAVQTIKREMTLVIKENEMLMKRVDALSDELEKQRKKYADLEKKHSHVLRQRNQLLTVIIVFVGTVLLIVFGPTLLRFLRVFIFRI